MKDFILNGGLFKPNTAKLLNGAGIAAVVIMVVVMAFTFWSYTGKLHELGCEELCNLKYSELLELQKYTLDTQLQYDTTTTSITGYAALGTQDEANKKINHAVFQLNNLLIHCKNEPETFVLTAGQLKLIKLELEKVIK